MKDTNLAPVCECNTIHEDVVQNVRSNMPEEEILYDLQNYLRYSVIRQG
jgi:ArsR family transcriptional regulator